MADEPESLVLRLLQEIRRDLGDVKVAQAEHTASFASIKETLARHGERLDTHSANFVDIGRSMRELTDLLRRGPSNAELARDLRALEMRVSALETAAGQQR